MASTKLEELLGKEMTRRQFLIAVGFGFLSLFGLSAVMGMLSGGDSGSPAMNGYGARDYGN
jgi:hypothetical protein